MGAWGHRNVENDDAMDFVAEFKEMPSENFLVESLGLIVEAGDGEEYIEAPEASAALAAAELVAAAVGNPAPDFPAELHESLTKMGISETFDVRKLARKAVKYLLKESELQELWAEGGEPNEWQAVQRDLLVRLK